MQESPNDIPEGETPHSVTLFGHDYLVDMAKPGDRITLTGIYKVEAVRVNPRVRMLRSVYKTFIDAIHISLEERSKLFTVKYTSPREDTVMDEKPSPPETEPTHFPVFTIHWLAVLPCIVTAQPNVSEHTCRQPHSCCALTSSLPPPDQVQCQLLPVGRRHNEMLPLVDRLGRCHVVDHQPLDYVGAVGCRVCRAAGSQRGRAEGQPCDLHVMIARRASLRVHAVKLGACKVVLRYTHTHTHTHARMHARRKPCRTVNIVITSQL